MRALVTTVLAAVLLAAVLLAACSSSAFPASSATPGGSLETAGESPSAAPTPIETAAGAYSALVFDLGHNSAPIDVVAAFGSIWTANHHSDDVARIDPATGEQIARIATGGGSGPGFFAVTDDAIWVTRQNSTGMARIDPMTNELVTEQVGDLAPCGNADAAQGAVWYFACDDGLMVRIDATTEEVSTIPAEHQSDPMVVDDVLYSFSPNGLLRLSDDGTGFDPVGGSCCAGFPIGYAAGTLWLAGEDGNLYRIDPGTGATVATIPLEGAVSAAGQDDGTVWVTVANEQVIHRFDTATNQELDPIEVGPNPSVLTIDDGILWLTDFGASELWRIDLDG